MQVNSKTFNLVYTAFIGRLTNNLREVGIPAHSDAEKLIVQVVTNTVQDMVIDYTKGSK